MKNYTIPSLQADQAHREDVGAQALAICEQALKPLIYDLPDNYDTRERFEEVLHTLNRQATPGIPYDQQAPTIGDWLIYDGFHYDQFRRDSLWHDVQKVLAGTYPITLKTFIKQEPHKMAKIRDQRWRLIICFPLCVQVAWKMLFDYTNIMMVDKAYEIPVQHGFQLFGGNWKHYYRQWTSQGLNAGTDISAYDFSTTWSKVYNSVFQLRVNLARGSRVGEWSELALRLYEQSYIGCTIHFPCGRSVRVLVNAIQKSGSPNTISDNSLLRFYESVYIALENGLSVYPLGSFVGDDALERIHPSDEETLMSAYRRRGWTIKQIERGLDYVGHRFLQTGPVPLYVEKHLYSVCFVTDSLLPEWLESMARLYAYSPHAWIWHELANVRGIRLMSKEYYKAWYTYGLDFPLFGEYRLRANCSFGDA